MFPLKYYNPVTSHITQIPQVPLDQVGHSSCSDIDCIQSHSAAAFLQTARIGKPVILAVVTPSYFLYPFHQFQIHSITPPNETSGHFITASSEMIDIEYSFLGQKKLDQDMFLINGQVIAVEQYRHSIQLTIINPVFSEISKNWALMSIFYYASRT